MIRIFFSRILYRCWQLKQVLFPVIDNEHWLAAISSLAEPLRQQLQLLKKSEKAHVLRVFLAITKDQTVKKETKDEMLQLALLHDIGKSFARHTVFFKIVKVLFPIANMQHCLTGAKFLRRHGVSRKLIRRVLRHHDFVPSDEVLCCFQKFDDKL